jgi:ketosteroid isomerase-like protein
MITATAISQTSDEAQIRKLIDDREKAVRARDADGSIANIAADIVWFDVVNPLQHLGSDALKERALEWFASFEGAIGYETRELSITAGNDVAFSHGLNHVSATKIGGGQLDMWWRSTVCFRKIGEKWIVTHEHNSVPFDVESGKASLDLRPTGRVTK